MDIQNHFYGHSAALARYTGQRRLRHIRGLVQHGWVAHSPLLMNFGDFPDVGRGSDDRRLFVWSHTSRAWSPEGQSRTTTPIGAPFLYLLRAQAQAQAQAQAGPRHSPSDARPLIVPVHRTHVRPLASDPPSLARFYRDAVGEALVCLHSEDLKDPGVVDAWRAAGHEVVSAGERFDTQFLPRIAAGILSASRVITNRLSTVAWYAIAAGVPATVFGPAPLAVGESPAELDRLVELWPELHHEDAPLEVTAPLAAGELGSDHVREPDELASLLGWSRPLSTRAFGDYWAGAPLGKALNVLGLRQREASASGPAAPSVGSAPKPLDFVRHPLSHLPRRLPALEQSAAPPQWCRPR